MRVHYILQSTHPYQDEMKAAVPCHPQYRLFHLYSRVSIGCQLTTTLIRRLLGGNLPAGS